MAVILAVEPDRKQAARLAAIVRHQVGAELVLADTTERALDALGARVPDMVLVPALLSPQDDASLAAALRVIAAAAHVRTLTIPVLASGSQETARSGFLSRWRRGRDESPTPDGCDPAVFAEQITAYLQEAAAERAEQAETPKPAVTIAETPEDEGFTAATTLGAREDEGFAAAAMLGAEEDEGFAAAAVLEEETLDEVPAIDLSDELVTLSVDAPEENLFAGEPFGTYTLPSVEEIQPDSPIVFETSLAPDVPVAWESPVAVEPPVVFEPRAEFESPAEFESSVVLESLNAFEAPVVLEATVAFEPPVTFETPVAFDPLDVFDAPVLFDAPDVFDAPVAIEAPIALEPPTVFEPSAVFETPVAFATPVAFEAPVTFEAVDVFEAPAAFEAPVALEPQTVLEPPAMFEAAAAFEPPAAFEHPKVLELMAPTPLTPWRAWPPLEGVPIEVPMMAAAKPEVPEWTELMASLRQDMERRRGQELPPMAKRQTRSKAAKPTVDEWGFFDPEQCGFSALLAKLDEITSA